MKQILFNLINFIAPIVLPVTLIYEAVFSRHAIYKKIIYVILITLVFGWIYYISLVGVINYVSETLLELGLTDKPIESQTRGPSMLPTLKENDTVMLSNPKKVGIKRGDIVTFSNEETEGLAYIKRVIGMPGEKILVRQGAVWTNGNPLDEPYVYNLRPTFGNTFLEECSEVNINADSYAVMGDNRAMSWDSRAIGFINKENIIGVRKENTPTAFKSPENIQEYTKTNPTALTVVKLINERRASEKANPLVTNSNVNNAANERVLNIINDFDGYKRGENNAEKSLEKINYRYNLIHEYITFGYLSDAEIVDQIFDTPEERDLFLSNKFTEIGVGIGERTKNACTYPVINIIISWPSQATYDESVINGWSNDEKQLNKNLANFQTWIGFPDKDQTKLKELINITSQMSLTASQIHTRMTNKEYLTAEDYSRIRNYNTVLLPKYESLFKEVFGANVQGVSTETLEAPESW